MIDLVQEGFRGIFSSLPIYTVEEWEELITHSWVALTLCATTLAAFILLTRLLVLAESRTMMGYASAGMATSFAMIMWRTVTLLILRKPQFPFPESLIFWSIQGTLTGFFIWAILMEWVFPPVPKLARFFFLVSIISFTVAIMAFMGRDN